MLCRCSILLGLVNLQTLYTHPCSLLTHSAGSEVWSRYVQPPVIPGHEFVGEVVKLGKGQHLSE